METMQLVVSTICGIFLFLIIFKFYFMKAAKCLSTIRLDGKTVIITGANAGIGKETAREMARRGACVILACRDLGRAEQAASDIIQSVPEANVVVKHLDLASMRSIKNFAEDMKNSFDSLHILINNAGVATGKRDLTEDGFEMTFGVNHLGHFLLTHLLRDLLIASAPSRIINVAAHAHLFISLDFDDLMMERDFGSIRAYCRSKLANVMFTLELAERWQDSGVAAFSLHPGIVHTSLPRHMGVMRLPIVGWMLHCLSGLLLKTAREGAQTTLYCALSEGILPYNGRYFSNCALSTPSNAALNKELRQKLWERSEQLLGLPPSEITDIGYMK